MEEREWMRERALEMDSHQECMGSSVVDAATAPVPLGLGVVVMDEVEEEEEEGELATWFWWKSMRMRLRGFGILLPWFRRRQSLSPVLFLTPRAFKLGAAWKKKR